jgi:hypothetical protein
LSRKPQWVFNKKKKRWQRKSPRTKNELYRQMLEASTKKNRIKFRYVLNDVWYASAENMRYIKEKLEKEFIMPLKANRKVALSLEDKKQGAYEQVASIELEAGTVREVYLEQVEFPLLLVKQVFQERGR